jgi:hypothetical protein
MEKKEFPKEFSKKEAPRPDFGKPAPKMSGFS